MRIQKIRKAYGNSVKVQHHPTDFVGDDLHAWSSMKSALSMKSPTCYIYRIFVFWPGRATGQWSVQRWHTRIFCPVADLTAEGPHLDRSNLVYCSEYTKWN